MSDWSRVDALLSAAVGQGTVPGVVAAATTGRKPIYHQAFGRLGLSGERAMASDSVFWIGSMTKAITSVAAMQLVGRGLLSLDAPIATIVPELANPSVLEGSGPDGTPRLRPARVPITLKHLMTHTSGFAEDVWSERIAAYVKLAGIPPSATRKRATLDLPLVADPGTQWQYGISHEWVGLAIERASGRRLDEYVRANIFEPLGMCDSTWQLRDELQPRLAEVYRRDSAGRLSPGVRKFPVAPEFVPGGGALYSTAGDYLAFIRMLLNGGRSESVEILTPDSVALMGENHTGAISVGKLVPAMPDMSNPVEFMHETRCCWGLGFQVNLEPLPTGRSAGSLAWAGLGNTYFWIDRARGVGGVLFTQILPFGDRAVLDLFARFETAVYDMLA
jgi:CubicO group peptidase (beta-lactamase class C family)